MSSDLNNIVTNAECKIVVEKKLGTNKFQLNNYSIQPISESRKGYLANHFFLNCEISVKDRAQTLSFFVKKKLQNASEFVMADIAENHDVFRNETTILQLLSKQSTTIDWAAKFYWYNEEKQYIVMENLLERGFTIAHTQLYDLKHCQAGLDTIAKLHTFSFKYQYDKQKVDSNYSIFDEFNDLFEEVLLHTNNEFSQKWMKASLDSVIYMVEHLPEQKLSKDRLRELIREKFDLFMKLSESFKSKYNVLSHGDLWGNNIMFRYADDDPKVPLQCCLVDFQVLRFLPPAQDVLFFLYLNTCKEFRDQYLPELFDYYYSQLSKELNKVDLCVDIVYPRDQFTKDCKRQLLPILFTNFIYKSFMWMGLEQVNVWLDNKEDHYEIVLGHRAKYIEPMLEQNSTYKVGILEEVQLLIDEIIEYS